jgi:hypothetical protein
MTYTVDLRDGAGRLACALLATVLAVGASGPRVMR